MFKKPIWFDALSAALEHPDQWILDESVIRHRPSGIELWIGGGRFNLGSFLDRGPNFSIVDRIRLWPKVKAMRDLVILNQLTASRSDCNTPKPTT